MEHAYPDFGFQDPLVFDLRSDTDMSHTYSIWQYLYNYISGKSRFERFDNIIDKLTEEKNNDMLQKIIKVHEKIRQKRQEARDVKSFTTSKPRFEKLSSHNLTQISSPFRQRANFTNPGAGPVRKLSNQNLRKIERTCSRIFESGGDCASNGSNVVIRPQADGYFSDGPASAAKELQDILAEEKTLEFQRNSDV